jgi:hypothetical protein
MREQGFFIGYFDLEEWAKNCIGNRINASLFSDPGTPGQYGQRIDKMVIECSQVQDDTAHYCRIPVVSIATMNGQPFDPDANVRRERAGQAWEMVRDWLTEQGFELRQAIVSMPRDLMCVDGWANFLGYDKEHGYFRK